MSSRKRSRKSKIVLRECIDGDDDNDTNSQDQNHTSNETTIQIKTTGNKLLGSNLKQTETTPLQFSVNITVEKFEEDNDNLVIDEDGIPNNDNLPVIPSDILPPSSKEEYVLEREEIIIVTNEIMEETNNIAEKSLCIAVKNSLGHFLLTYLNSFESKIQMGLMKWMDWSRSISANAEYRTTPLFYKCYMCERSWWYLHNFKQHLKNHTIFKLKLEEYTKSETTLIAYKNTKPSKQQFQLVGNCPKCGEDYDYHKKENRISNLYSCKIGDCKKSFPTCDGLKTHETKCHTSKQILGTVINTVKWKKTCEVCEAVFFKRVTYENHMILSHSVRSDVVVYTIYRLCELCKRRYLYHEMLHICVMKGLTESCQDCFRKFPSGYLLLSSHKNNNTVFKCPICNVCLPKRCMEVKHLMSHTNKFMFVHKCILCKEFRVFTNQEAAKYHNSVVHASYRQFDDIILIPKKCLLTLDKGAGNETPCVKVEPIDLNASNESSISIFNPEINIKTEIDSETCDLHSDNETVQIKQEIDIDEMQENMQEDSNNVIDEPMSVGIKIEQTDEELRMQDMQDTQEIEEAEYETDIIRLAPNISEKKGLPRYVMKLLRRPVELKNPKLLKTAPKLYRCYKCDLDFIHKDFKEHIKTDCKKIDEMPSYTCTKCNINYKTIKSYLTHFTNHGFKPRSCPICYQVFDTHTTLISHVFMHINMRYRKKRDSNNIVVDECKTCFEKVEKTDFFKHWESHLAIVEMDLDVDQQQASQKQMDQEIVKKIITCLQSTYTNRNKPGCFVCHRYFNRRNDLKRHLIEHLLSDAYLQRPKYLALKCQICEQMLDKADDYKQHMRDHGALPLYRCEMCNKCFSDSSNFAKHKKVHNINAYTCDICGRKFNAKFSIEKHMKIHEIEKPIYCALCDKTFYLKTTFRKHNFLIHNKAAAQFRCIICSERFNCLKDKWDHCWEVHKERKHQADCTLCPQRFRKYRDLYMHMRNQHQTPVKYKDFQTKKLNDILSTIPADDLNKPKEETLVVFI